MPSPGPACLARPARPARSARPDRPAELLLFRGWVGVGWEEEFKIKAKLSQAKAKAELGN